MMWRVFSRKLFGEGVRTWHLSHENAMFLANVTLFSPETHVLTSFSRWHHSRGCQFKCQH